MRPKGIAHRGNARDQIWKLPLVNIELEEATTQWLPVTFGLLSKDWRNSILVVLRYRDEFVLGQEFFAFHQVQICHVMKAYLVKLILSAVLSSWLFGYLQDFL